MINVKQSFLGVFPRGAISPIDSYGYLDIQGLLSTKEKSIRCLWEQKQEEMFLHIIYSEGNTLRHSFLYVRNVLFQCKLIIAWRRDWYSQSLQLISNIKNGSMKTKDYLQKNAPVDEQELEVRFKCQRKNKQTLSKWLKEREKVQRKELFKRYIQQISTCS